MLKPRFSVGIPTKDQAEFLPRTLDSLLEQQRPPDEIVISDHQSTDGTAEVIDAYAQRHPGLIRGTQPPPGSGVSAQWQHTLSCLSGDWVTLFSSDDLARPDFCAVLMEGAARQENAVLVRAGWENIDLEDRVLSQQYMLSVKGITRAPANLLEQRHGPKASFAAFAVRRAALEQSGGYPKDMESFGDLPMFAQLAPFGSFVYQPRLISGYRVGHDGNKFRKRIGMWLRDEQRMFNNVFPLAADRLRMKDRKWITKASRTNFLRYLASASAEFRPEERAALLPDFRSWANLVGEDRLLDRFAAGQTIQPTRSFLSVIKSVLRPIVHKRAQRSAGR